MYKPTPKDEQLERELDALQRTFLATSHKPYRERLWAQIRELHAKRSPGMVRLMEEQQGLR